MCKQFVGGFSKEWWTPDQELVEHHAHGPPIDRLAVPLAEDDLWRDILRGATDLLVLELLCIFIYRTLVKVGGHYGDRRFDL